jgi:Na+/H+ antiporter NhaA
VVRPLQEFLQTSTASAALLLIAAVAALVWVNSPWGDSYRDIWHTELTLRIGGWSISEDLQHWVNDALMAFFFLLVGLEIKREVTVGELRDPRAVALPAIAALGGMVVPAAIYVALNAGGEGASGWGVPVATDIAFALGVLTIAARHAPANLKPFLLTLAIVDDIGAILLIAIFYSGGIDPFALTLAVGIGASIWGLQRIHVRANPVYIALGVALWLATYEAGVHPTIAGVTLGILTPVVPFQRPRAVSDEAERIAEATIDDPEPPDVDAHLWFRLAWLSREAVSPLARVEHLLLPWSSFVIVPLFALANAGVELSVDAVGAAVTSPITIGVVLGLVAGKLIGITGASWLALRVGVGRLPRNVAMRDVAGAAGVAGIGFTVALFVAELAFDDALLQDEAKIGILVGSVIAGLVGYLLLRLGPQVSRDDRLDEGLVDAEQRSVGATGGMLPPTSD